METNQSKIPRILSADDLANFRYLIGKYGLEPANLSIVGTINAGGGFLAGGTTGVSGTIELAKLTGGGTTGAVTVKDGIITAISNPT